MRRKKIINKQKITRKTAVYLIYQELCQSLGNKFSAQFLYDKAEKIFELRKPTTMYKDHFGQPSNTDKNYYTRNVSCLIENDPWLAVYNEDCQSMENSFNKKNLLNELGI